MRPCLVRFSHKGRTGFQGACQRTTRPAIAVLLLALACFGVTAADKHEDTIVYAALAYRGCWNRGRHGKISIVLFIDVRRIVFFAFAVLRQFRFFRWSKPCDVH